MTHKGPPIIKLSGKALSDEKSLKQLFSSFVQHKAIVVHGGGVEVDSLLAKLGITSQKIDGIRVSPSSDMPYITAALAGICNKTLQSYAIASNIKAIGLLATDAKCLTLQKYDAKYGCVASAVANDKSFLTSLLEQDIIPIICSIGHDEQGQLYNINADDVACALAKLFNSDLYFISDVCGVLDQNKELIDFIDKAKCEQLIKDKVITDGMIVKVKMALEVSSQTKNNVVIASIHDPLLTQNLFMLRRFGTTVLA